MNNTKFENQLLELEQIVIDYLDKNIKEGDIIHLYKEEELEENDNILYELPNVTYVNKHSIYDEYAVVGVKKIDKLILLLEGKGEMSGSNQEISLYDISSTSYGIDTYNLCKLADKISKHIF